MSQQGSFYDIPQLLAGQALSGQLPRVSDTFLNRDALTPTESQGVSGVLGLESDNRFFNTAAELATNPFVWLWFLTSPVGGAAVQQSAGNLFKLAPKVSLWAKDHMPFLSGVLSDLQAFRGTGGDEVSTHVTKRMAALRQADHEVLAPLEARLAGAINRKNKLSGKVAIVALDWEDAVKRWGKDSTQAREIKRVSQLMAVKAHRLDEDVDEFVSAVETRYTATIKGETSTWGSGMDATEARARFEGMVRHNKQKTKEINAQRNDKFQEYFNRSTRPTVASRKAEAAQLTENWYQNKLADETYTFDDIQIQTVGKDKTPTKALFSNIDSEWGAYGPELDEYFQQTQHLQRRKFAEALGDMDVFEASGGRVFKLDREKAGRFVQAIRREYTDGGPTLNGTTSLQGREAVEELIVRSQMYKKELSHAQTPEEILNGIKKLSDKDLYTELEKLLTPENFGRTTYSSRNMSQPVAPDRNGPRRWTGSASLASQRLQPYQTSRLQNQGTPLTARDPIFDPDDLEDLSGLLTEEGKRMAKNIRLQAFVASKKEGLYALRLDYMGSTRKHLADLDQWRVWDLETLPPEIAKAWDDFTDNQLRDTFKGDVRYGSGNEIIHAEPVSVPDGWKMSDIDMPFNPKNMTAGAYMDRLYRAAGDNPKLQKRMIDYMIPNMLTQAGPAWMNTINNQQRAKSMAASFVKTPLASGIRQYGGQWGRGFIDNMEQLADPSLSIRANDLTSGLARYLYVTHLGVNMSSVMLNLMQPLVLASTIGSPGQVLKAYGESIKEMGRYASLRMSRHGGKLFLTDEEKTSLIRDSFRFAREGGENVLDIGPGTSHLVDAVLPQTRTGRAEEFFMKLFEKSEWFNRNTTAHIFDQVNSASAKPASGAHKLALMSRFVQETQFSASHINTPHIFQTTFLSNPLLRQFLTFPLRSAVAAGEVFPRLGGQSYLKGLANFTARALATSAFTYEVGKNLVGVDLSRGLFVSSSTDLFGGEKLLQDGNEFIPVPPVVDIPIDILKGIAGGDINDLSNGVARLVPGGVALNRVLGLSPSAEESGVPLISSLQKTYVDWSQPNEQGLFPVYRHDGALIEYRPATQIIAKGLGIDLNSWQAQGGIDRYLMAQREEMIGLRRQILQAYAGNDYRQARRLEAQWASRFRNPETGESVPFTVTANHIRQYDQLQSKDRTQRILDRMPRESRELYRSVVESVPNAVVPGPGLSPEEQNRLRQLIQERTRQEAVGPAAAFPAFSPFN